MRAAPPNAALRTAWLCPVFSPLLALLSLALLYASLSLATQPGSHESIYYKRGLDINLGLSANNLDKNGISLGFLPAWGEPMSPNNASSLNALLPRPMSMIGAYAQILSADPNMTQLQPYLDDLLRQPGDRPVFALALMPSEGLDSITPEVAERVARKMGELNAQGITVWLRYAHEMNGEWYAWGQQPEAFLASWNLVTTAVRAYAPETYMLWSPNSLYSNTGNTSDIYGGYEPYWPGAENVDIVGLSFYHYGGFERLNNWPRPDEARNVMTRFDQMFGSTQGIAFVLSETGAAWTRDADSGVNAPGNATESEIKWNWLWQLTNPDISRALPSYKALCWFEVVKDENASGNSIVKEEDFRLVSGDSDVAVGSRSFLSQTDIVHNRTDMTSVAPMGAAAASPTASSSDSATSATGGAVPARPLSSLAGAAAASLLLLCATLALVA